jgi:protein SCO1/2
MGAGRGATIRSPFGLVLLALLSLFASLVVGGTAATASGTNPPDPTAGVGIEQRLDKTVPLDLTVRDETGRAVHLGDYFGAKPVILTLNYYRCPTLCSLILTSLERGLQGVAFDVGKQFEVVTVSIDPTEGATEATEKKAEIVGRYGRPGAAAGWHFLTGDEAQIQRLAAAVGFHYTYDARQAQYVHPSGIMLLTPAGRLARYLLGIDYAARDLRLGLVEAADGRIGAPSDQILLLCYHYDAATGRYAGAVDTFIKGTSIAVAVALTLLIGLLLRRERRKGAEV